MTHAMKPVTLSIVTIFFFISVNLAIGQLNEEKLVTGKPYCKVASELLVGYKCVNDTCQRTVKSTLEGDTCLSSLNVCKLLCGKVPLWPFPTGEVNVSKDLAYIQVKDIQFNYVLPESSENKLKNLLDNLKYYLEEESSAREFGEIISNGVPLHVIVKIIEPVFSFYDNTDESYSLKITTVNEKVCVIADANTYFGARHGIETLLQLIVYDENSKTFVIPNSATIFDKPAYKYRGFMLDTSRNYFPVEIIKRTLDAMAMNKLNTFHWHITDSHSFPYVSKKYPEMAAIGAYSAQKVYSRADINDLVEYARIRGIRVIPELDAPAHIGEGWQNFKDKMTGESYLNCFMADPWNENCVEPPCGQLNPTIEGVYDVLSDIYEEYNSLFDSDFFHMGGDEVRLNCWNTTNIRNWITEKYGEDATEDLNILWKYFQDKAADKLNKINGGKQRIILWTSGLTRLNYVPPEKYVIQIWDESTSSSAGNLLKAGYHIIFSNYDALYLDCGFGGWVTDGVNWCSPYKEWQKFYTNNPVEIVRNQGLNYDQYKEQILGSEAALWSEQADSEVIDSRVWPRVAAFAERLWSNPTSSWRVAEPRLLHQRERMVNRGIHCDSVQPKWCLQHEGHCPLRTSST